MLSLLFVGVQVSTLTSGSTAKKLPFICLPQHLTKKTKKQYYFLTGGVKFSEAKKQVLFQGKLDFFSQLYVDSCLLVTFSLQH